MEGGRLVGRPPRLHPFLPARTAPDPCKVLRGISVLPVCRFRVNRGHR